MYIISIHVKNAETGNEDFSLIGRDFLPIGKQDYSATVFDPSEYVDIGCGRRRYVGDEI